MGMTKFQEKLFVNIKANVPCNWIITNEESRCLDQSVNLITNEKAKNLNFKPLYWDCCNGLTHDREGTNSLGGANTNQLTNALPLFMKQEGKCFLILKDPTKLLQIPNHERAFKNTISECNRSFKDKNNKKMMIVIDGDSSPINHEDIFTIEFKLPGKDEIRNVIKTIINSYINMDYLKKNHGIEIDDVVNACVGLGFSEIMISCNQSFHSSGTLNPIEISKIKKNIIEKEGMLTWVDVKDDLNRIAGLDILKTWLIRRKKGFSLKAKEKKIDPPKGILIVGVPGCGKSLTAKCVAGSWGYPLIRLDIANLFGGVVGETERRTRMIQSILDSIGNAVVWMDEVEKAFAGAESTGQTDGGVGRRMFGNFLSWLQDREGEVFIVATCNDIASLPTEFKRKGRWDEIWFVNLPNKTERIGISEIICGLKDLKNINHNAIANISEGYTGAELESAVKEAQHEAFFEDRDVVTEDIIKQIKVTQPLSKTEKEKIDLLISWKNGKARDASIQDTNDIGEDVDYASSIADRINTEFDE